MLKYLSLVSIFLLSLFMNTSATFSSEQTLEEAPSRKRKLEGDLERDTTLSFKRPKVEKLSEHNCLPSLQVMPLPLDIILQIARFTRIREGILMASAINKAISEQWNEPLIWKHYVSRIPGHARLNDPSPTVQTIRSLLKPTFEPLTIPYWKEVYHGSIKMSADGTMLGGQIYNREQLIRSHHTSDVPINKALAFIWSQQDGLLILKSPYGDSVRSISQDKQVVVGHTTYTPDGESQPFRWSRTEGIQLLGPLNGGEGESHAWSVNKDGTVIVGEAPNGEEGNETKAFIWTPETGMQLLDSRSEGQSTAEAITPDGKVVIGSSEEKMDFIWTPEAGMRDLENVYLTGGRVNIIDASGNTLVCITNHTGAFLWKIDSERRISLAPFFEMDEYYYAQKFKIGWPFITNDYCDPEGINEEGNVVVGRAKDLIGDLHPFIWFEDIGMFSVESLLTGLVPEGHYLGCDFVHVTSDGTQVIGGGYSQDIPEDLQIPAWRAYIPPVGIYQKEGLTFKFMQKPWPKIGIV